MLTLRYAASAATVGLAIASGRLARLSHAPWIPAGNAPPGAAAVSNGFSTELGSGLEGARQPTHTLRIHQPGIAQAIIRIIRIHVAEQLAFGIRVAVVVTPANSGTVDGPHDTVRCVRCGVCRAISNVHYAATQQNGDQNCVPWLKQSHDDLPRLRSLALVRCCRRELDELLTKAECFVLGEVDGAVHIAGVG